MGSKGIKRVKGKQPPLSKDKIIKEQPIRCSTEMHPTILSHQMKFNVPNVPGKDIWPRHAEHTTCSVKYDRKWGMSNKCAEPANQEIRIKAPAQIEIKFLKNFQINKCGI